MPDAAVVSAVDKTRAVRNEMKDELVERGVEIDLMLASILGRVHMLMLGEPGVAKSMVTDQFMSHVEGANKFSILMNKQTPPESLIGPISLTAMKEDRFRRVTTGFLPEAHIAFLDELFKSNSVNLNLLLKIANERIFENDGELIRVPLWSIIGASNELPGHDKEELMAFADRIGVRRIVQPVKTDDGVRLILEGQLARNKGELLSEAHTMLTIEEIEELQTAVTQVTVPNRVLDKIVELRTKAERENLHLSMRRVFEGVKVCQAQALLADRGEVNAEDLRLFEHILWNDPDEIEIASALTLDFAGTIGKQVARGRNSLEELHKRMTAAQAKMPADDSVKPDADVIEELTSVMSELTKLGKQVEKDIADGTTEGHDTAELETIRAEVDRGRRSIRQSMGMEF
jgi:MoxR-like ATPase